ncbi:MAG: alpha-glucuronidase [Clostridiales bacterium]|nr:alpha-glucuronidase [Clostridiales bacterium]
MKRIFGENIWNNEAASAISLEIDGSLSREGYRAASDGAGGIRVSGADASGVIYGVFALLRELACGRCFYGANVESSPKVPLRIINHWDRTDGTIERGYAGDSLFFKDGGVSFDVARIVEYARLLASIGINAIVVNNVNVNGNDIRLISKEMIPEVAKLADIFRVYGIRLALSVHFESPVMLDCLPSADPLDENAISWWKRKCEEIYRFIPDFAGFLVKVDSEFRGGPQALGRSQAEGANMLARALQPFGGIVWWRCFIYNNLQDWRDSSIDRPKAPYELFKPQDGLFDSNVMLQVKNGPSDFQVREPNSPLLGAMKHTKECLELQITQEYTGHQIDLYSLASQWEEVFAFPSGSGRALSDLMGDEIASIAGVANVGLDDNWTGHTLAQANLYAFGRLAWNPRLSAKDVTEEWVKLTFGLDKKVNEALPDMILRSRKVYEKYNSPLGLGWMVNVAHHYGPSPEGYEFTKWGTYHRASCKAIGIDRTAKGTGFTRQYSAEIARMLEDARTCPEELLLYFHRLPYSFELKSGETLLQHIYDAHFEGVEDVEAMIELWRRLEKHIPKTAFASVSKRLEMQLENAKEWRDVINTYFFRMTGIPDKRRRKIYP